MVLMIAYRDRPDEILHSFEKVSDTVCIGRDKRQCGIALGVNAQGVSRVHLKLELQPNGRLLARDISTYGTGYNGGPFIVEKEKELEPGMILQIGSYFFIIKERNNGKCVEHAQNNGSLGTAGIDCANSWRRSGLKNKAVIMEESDIKRKKVKTDVVDDIDSEFKDKGIAKGQEEVPAISSRCLTSNKAWVQEQDRKLTAKLGKLKMNLDSESLNYYRKIADFLPSDDEYDDVARESNILESVASGMSCIKQKEGSMGRNLSGSESGNSSTSDVVDDTYFSDFGASHSSKSRGQKSVTKEATGSLEDCALIKNVETETQRDSNIVIRKEKEAKRIGKIATDMSKPSSSNIQLGFPHNDPTENVNESSSVTKFGDGDRFSDLLKLRSSTVFEGTITGRSRSNPAKELSRIRDSVSSKGSDVHAATVTELVSQLGKNTSKKRSNQFDNQSDINEVAVEAKRIKTTAVDDENNLKEEHKKEDLAEKLEDDENIGSNDLLTLGMDIEILRLKMKKAVQFENLERPFLTEVGQQSGNLCSLDDLQKPNYKRFKKAAQGYYGYSDSLHSSTTQIIGVLDLIDFRELTN